MKNWFDGYGWLEYLEPEEFWADRWSVYETVKDEDNYEWDVVIRDGEFKYTSI